VAILRYVILSFLLLFVSHAKAETIPATYTAAGASTVPWVANYKILTGSGPIYPSGGYIVKPSFSGACSDYVANSGFPKSFCTDSPSGTTSHGASAGACRYYFANTYCSSGDVQFLRTCSAGYSLNADYSACVNVSAIYVCPSVGGWTLSGATCTRPDHCLAGQETSFNIFSGFSIGKGKIIKGGSSNPYVNSTNRCNDDGCVIDVKSVTECPAVIGTVDKPSPILCYGVGVNTGATCVLTADTSISPPSVAPVVPTTKPVCSPTQGVLTTSAGTVACIDAGTPSQVPVIAKSTQVTNYPDGSTKTTTTTYTKDPATQVQDTNVSSATTGVGGATGSGATAGQAGAVGTSTSTGSQSASGGTGAGGTDDSAKSDLCKDHPDLDLCTGKLNKEETQKKISDVLSADGFDAETHLADGMAESDTVKNDTKSKVDDYVTEVKKFGTGSDIASGSYSEFRDAMGGWLDPIPSSSCSPFDARIGLWTWHFDHCPIAAKISEIGAYCAWVLLVFGIFSMVTREGK
jgi:hypothetical protein